MKKLTYLLLGASFFLLGACSQEEVSSPDSAGIATAQFKVSLPSEFATRSLGDGLAATQLSAFVYEVTSNDATDSYSYIFTGSSTFESSSYSTTITLELVTGKSYFIAFFASSTGASDVYSVDPETGVLTANYDEMTSANNLLDAYDCFTGTFATGLVGNSSISGNVNLTRPVAQINWGTTGLNSNSNFSNEFGVNGDYILTDLNIKNAYSTYSLINGEYGGEEEVNITSFASPATLSGSSYPLSGYRYVAMQYVLAPATTATYDLELTIRNNGGSNTAGTYENTITVSSAPVQADYQTNIYGSLLSATTTLSISKQTGANWGNFDQPLAWDGTATTPSIDETNKTVAINGPSDLAGLAALVNHPTNPNTFENYTISLNSDFDMNQIAFPAIGSGSRNGSSVSGNSFKGVFDGQGHTISNLNITGTTTGSDAVGFIPNLDGSSAMVKNVTFSNLVINAPENEQVGAIATVTNGANVQNVTVKSGSVTAKEGAGGVVGRLIINGTVSQCENYATITTGTNGGGIVGAAYRTANGQTATVSNCNNYGNVSGTSQGIGGVVGLSSAVVKGCSNSGTVSCTAGSSVGGIVGQQNDAGSISNCTNTGNVTGGSASANYGAGGIVGWVRYTNETSAYPVQNIITVTDCRNSGNIKAMSGAGGIVGIWYNCGQCDNNMNTAKTISATGFSAGIVGGSQWTEAGPVTLTNVAGVNSLTVNDNISTTPLSDITGGSKAQYVYINSPQTTESGNSSSLQ